MPAVTNMSGRAKQSQFVRRGSFADEWWAQPTLQDRGGPSVPNKANSLGEGGRPEGGRLEETARMIREIKPIRAAGTDAKSFMGKELCSIPR